MNEKSLLLDPTAAVQEAHNDLIANGTIAVVSAGRVARASQRRRQDARVRVLRPRPPVSPLRNRRAALVENHVAPRARATGPHCSDLTICPDAMGEGGVRGGAGLVLCGGLCG